MLPQEKERGMINTINYVWHFIYFTDKKYIMMRRKLSDKKVAILVADGFEESEFVVPTKALKEEGAYIEIISLKKGKVKSWKNGKWGKQYAVDKTIQEAFASDYDALVLPGGVMNPDKLRIDPAAVEFVGEFFDAEKPIAAICHGPWTLIETGELRGRTMTSYPSLKTDLTNAGANWIDSNVVVDRGLVTSRNPNDLNAFCKRMVEEIQDGSPALKYKMEVA
jgi:protease I